MIDIIVAITIANLVTTWLNIIISLALFFCGTIVSIAIADKARILLYNSGMNLITLYAGMEQARLNKLQRQHLLNVEIEKARLSIREQRHLLLDSLGEL